MSAIKVSNLGKAYKHYSSRWARLAEWLFPFLGERHQLKWVLKGLSFSVQPGEAMGIIGINGAGKSTLLKMSANTVRSTEGEVQINGKVAALLELGMGFHPDFTGRQNVYMAGQLLGYSSSEITYLMPEVESFAEIGEYIDQPVRVYSSGMQMRLAFSVATVRRPDVLIIDEALSVGDAYFQHKSFERIREFRKQGTTLLIVSHDKAAIQSICDVAILINGGHLELVGRPEEVFDYYNASLAQDQNQSIVQSSDGAGRLQTVSGTGEAVITSIDMINQQGDIIDVIGVGEHISLKINALIKKPIERLVLGFGIKDRLGQVIYGTNTHLKNQALENLEQDDQISFFISFTANLGVGTYSLQTALVSSDTHLKNNYEWRDLAFIFTIVNKDKDHFAGCLWMDPDIRIEVNG